jgi:hypothetical protein
MVRKLTVHKKGYHRKGYTKKSGVKVKPAYIPPTTFKIKDRGKAGRQKEEIEKRKMKIKKAGGYRRKGYRKGKKYIKPTFVDVERKLGKEITYHGRKGKPVIHTDERGRKYIMVRKSGGGTKRLYEGSRYRVNGKIEKLEL